MAEWAKIEYTKRQIDFAGDVLVTPMQYTADDLERAYEVIGNWRSCHGFPLNTMQNYLRRKAKAVDGSSLIAQRIKRLSSIRLKLGIYSSMKLSRMQDIGGCRAVLSTVSQVRLVCRQYSESDIKHKLIRSDDYISEPKESGYRGVHLVYRYHSDKNQIYNGLSIETQLRSSLQHAWATAVETVGTFIRQALKSSCGERDWLRFFALMGSEIAIREHTPVVPGTPSTRKMLREELRHYAQLLDVEGHLETYGAALKIMEQPHVLGAHYFLLELDSAEKSVKITGYKNTQLPQAEADYLRAEKRKADIDAVLVSVDSIASLKRAYPNYFLDTSKFIGVVKRAVS